MAGEKDEQLLHFSPRFRHQTPTIQSAYQCDNNILSKLLKLISNTFFPCFTITCSYTEVLHTIQTTAIKKEDKTLRCKLNDFISFPLSITFNPVFFYNRPFYFFLSSLQLFLTCAVHFLCFLALSFLSSLSHLSISLSGLGFCSPSSNNALGSSKASPAPNVPVQ